MEPLQGATWKRRCCRRLALVIRNGREQRFPRRENGPPPPKRSRRQPSTLRRCQRILLRHQSRLSCQRRSLHCHQRTLHARRVRSTATGQLSTATGELSTNARDPATDTAQLSSAARRFSTASKQLSAPAGELSTAARDFSTATRRFTRNAGKISVPPDFLEPPQSRPRARLPPVARFSVPARNQAILDALAAVVAALRTLRAPGMIIGGIAVIAHGVPRQTVDVDATDWGEEVELASSGRRWEKRSSSTSRASGFRSQSRKTW